MGLLSPPPTSPLLSLSFTIVHPCIFYDIEIGSRGFKRPSTGREGKGLPPKGSQLLCVLKIIHKSCGGKRTRELSITYPDVPSLPNKIKAVDLVLGCE
jgi:hypothetical protein